MNRIAASVIGRRNMKKPCCVSCWNLPPAAQAGSGGR
ncbi:hypothetical protein ACNKHU_24535 [Shigella flexneri]